MTTCFANRNEFRRIVGALCLSVLGVLASAGPTLSASQSGKIQITVKGQNAGDDKVWCLATLGPPLEHGGTTMVDCADAPTWTVVDTGATKTKIAYGTVVGNHQLCLDVDTAPHARDIYKLKLWWCHGVPVNQEWAWTKKNGKFDGTIKLVGRPVDCVAPNAGSNPQGLPMKVATCDAATQIWTMATPSTTQDFTNRVIEIVGQGSSPATKTCLGIKGSGKAGDAVVPMDCVDPPGWSIEGWSKQTGLAQIIYVPSSDQTPPAGTTRLCLTNPPDSTGHFQRTMSLKACDSSIVRHNRFYWGQDSGGAGNVPSGTIRLLSASECLAVDGVKKVAVLSPCATGTPPVWRVAGSPPEEKDFTDTSKSTVWTAPHAGNYRILMVGGGGGGSADEGGGGGSGLVEYALVPLKAGDVLTIAVGGGGAGGTHHRGSDEKNAGKNGDWTTVRSSDGQTVDLKAEGGTGGRGRNLPGGAGGSGGGANGFDGGNRRKFGLRGWRPPRRRCRSRVERLRRRVLQVPQASCHGRCGRNEQWPIHRRRWRWRRPARNTACRG